MAQPVEDVGAFGAILAVDPERLRAEVRNKYREVAENPTGGYHFNTGRHLAERLGYPPELIDWIPPEAVESFAGIANPPMAGAILPGAKIVDIGSGGGFDSFVAALLAGDGAQVVGIDMTPEMIDRARSAATGAPALNVEFRQGIAEELPIESGWADMVISNGVLNLVVDKPVAFAEINRVLRHGGVLQFGDIANGKPVPERAKSNIDLWAA